MKLKINIITQLSSFLVLAVMVNQIGLVPLFFIVSLLIVVLIQIKSQHFFRLIKRMKWFFIVMLFIFSLNTPGEHIQGWSYFLSPTYEGLQSGLLQVLRMLTLLATLSLIMAFNHKQQLVSGFYFILLPLRYVGLEVERFAARLWLTLDYVESAQPNKQENFFEQLKALSSISNTQQSAVNITFKMPVFKWMDYLLLSSLMLVCNYVLMKAFI